MGNNYFDIYSQAYQEFCKWKLRSNIGDNPLAAVIFMIFLKYVNDNRKKWRLDDYVQFSIVAKGESTGEGFQHWMEDYINALEMKLGFPGKILINFVKEFEFESIYKTFNSVRKDFDKLEFSEEIVGNMPYDIFVEYLNVLARKDLRIGTDTLTDYRLACLMSLLADVGDGCSFYDFASGYGVSAIECTRKKQNVKIVLQDIQKTCSAISLMLLTISGVEKADVKCGDSFREPEFWRGDLDGYDRIVCDPPFGNKLTKEEMQYLGVEQFLAYPGNHSSGDMVPVRLTANLLAYGGIGIIVIPLGLLSRMGSDQHIRKKLVEDGFVDGIVELPAGLIPGTASRAALLIMKKTGEGGEVYFLDLNREAGKKYLDKLPRAGYTLKKESIKELSDIIKKHIVLPELSERVSIKEIAANSFNLSTGQYIKVHLEMKKADNAMSLIEENQRLEQMYANETVRFNNIFSELRKDK